MKNTTLALPVFTLLFCGIPPLTATASPKTEAQKCYYADPISKSAYDKAMATLQRKPNALDSLICAAMYQADSLKQYPTALQTLKRAEQVSLKSDERELDAIYHLLANAARKLPASGSYADDRNYYQTTSARAKAENVAAFKRCWAADDKENFDAAIDAASASVWRNTLLSDGNFCLGRAYKHKGNYAQALIHFHRLELASDGIANGLPIAQGALSGLYDDIGQYEQALDYGNKALNEWRRLGNKRGEAALLNNIALIYKQKGDKRRAITYYEQSLDLEDKDADKAAIWNNLALIYADEGDIPKAIDYLTKALIIDQQAGNRLNVAIRQLNLGNIYLRAKDYPQAELQLQAGLQAVQQLGAKAWEAKAHGNLGALRFEQGRLDEAKQLTQKAIDISRQTGAVDQTAVKNLEFFNKQ